MRNAALIDGNAAYFPSDDCGPRPLPSEPLFGCLLPSLPGKNFLGLRSASVKIESNDAGEERSVGLDFRSVLISGLIAVSFVVFNCFNFHVETKKFINS